MVLAGLQITAEHRYAADSVTAHTVVVCLHSASVQHARMRRLCIRAVVSLPIDDVYAKVMDRFATCLLGRLMTDRGAQGFITVYLYSGFVVVHLGTDAKERTKVVTLRSARTFNDGQLHSVMLSRNADRLITFPIRLGHTMPLCTVYR
jgi:hypothetical protein